MPVKVTIAQFSISIGDTQRNWSSGMSAIRQAADESSRLIQLPELWISGYDLSNCEGHSRNEGEYAGELQHLADRYDLAIGGSMITLQNGVFFNSYHLFVPGQKLSHRYQKTHLFKLLDETRYFAPGESLTTVDLGWGTVGLAICYDVRFPELVRAYANRGVECLLVAAQWGMKRKDHWNILLKARAIENQLFIVASNAIGFIHENQLAGSSTVVDPWGDPLYLASDDQPDIRTVEIDLKEIDRVRQLVPSRIDQRTSLYQRWTNELTSASEE